MADKKREDKKGDKVDTTHVMNSITAMEAMIVNLRSRDPNLANMMEVQLDSIRLNTKYNAFDLEATRRENGYLRRMLEEGK